MLEQPSYWRFCRDLLPAHTGGAEAAEGPYVVWRLAEEKETLAY